MQVVSREAGGQSLLAAHYRVDGHPRINPIQVKKTNKKTTKKQQKNNNKKQKTTKNNNKNNKTTKQQNNKTTTTKQQQQNNNNKQQTTTKTTKTRYSTRMTFVQNCVRHCTLWKRLCHNSESS